MDGKSLRCDIVVVWSVEASAALWPHTVSHDGNIFERLRKSNLNVNVSAVSPDRFDMSVANEIPIDSESALPIGFVPSSTTERPAALRDGDDGENDGKNSSDYYKPPKEAASGSTIPYRGSALQ